MRISSGAPPPREGSEGKERPGRRLSAVVEGGVWLLLILTPLALGSVYETASVLLEGACFALLILAWWAGREPRPSRVPAVFKAVAAAFVVWTLFQMVPLPPGLLKWVSPGTERLYEKDLPGYAREGGVDLQAWLAQRRDTGSKDLSARGDFRTGLEGRFRVAPGWKPISWYPEETLQWLARFAAYWCFFLLVADFLPRRAVHHRLPWLLLLLGAGIAIEGVVQHLTWNRRIFWFIKVYQGHPYGPWVNNNHFSGYLEMVLPLGVAVLLKTRRRGTGRRGRHLSARSAFLTAALAVLALISVAGGLLAARSRGGLFSVAFIGAVYLLAQVSIGRWRRRHRRLAPALAVLLVLVLVGAIVAYILIPTLRPATRVSEVEPSFAGRVLAWKGILAMVAANPLAGTGLGTFGLAYPLFKTYGMTGVWLQAHNDYLQVLAESGLVGFALLAVGIVLLLRKYLLPVIRAPWRRPDPLALGAALGLMVLLFHALVDFNLQIPSNGLLFVLLGALLVRFASPEEARQGDSGTRDAEPELPGNP